MEDITRVDLGGVSGGGGYGLPLITDAEDPRYGTIDMGWAASQHASQSLRYCNTLHTDGKGGAWREDSAVPLSRDLNYVLEFVRDNYRPLKYASVLRSISVPDWAEYWEISKITGKGGGVALGSQLGQRDIPRPEIDRTTTTGRMFEIVNGYSYTNRELIRAGKLGVNVSTERAMIQQQAADEFLDQLIATGSSGTNNPVAGMGLTGLGNNADLVTAVMTGANKAGGDSAWQDAVAADFGLVLDDLHNLISRVYVNSKERRNADTIVMPLDEFNALNRLRAANFSANVLDTWMEEWNKRIGKPGRIIVWDRFAALGTVASGPRVLAFDSTDTNVACYVMGKPYGVDQVLEVTRGFEVNASMVCGGVRILDSNGLQYLDLNPGA